MSGFKASIYLARILISKSQGKEAEQLLQKLLEANPPAGITFEANYWLGEIAQADNRSQEAISRYAKACTPAGTNSCMGGWLPSLATSAGRIPVTAPTRSDP